MTRHFIFQVNPQKEHRLSDALEEMRRQGAKSLLSLLLSPKPETNNPKLSCGDVVYLWESASKKPALPGRLVARGKVAQAPAMPMCMPAWQRTFCVDKATGKSGPQFHSTMPRAEIKVELLAGRKVERNHTAANQTLSLNSFFKKPGYYSKTIFDLTENEALELDKLACWQAVVVHLP